MEAWVSWMTFLAIVGAAYWYYSQNNRSRARGRSTAQRTTTATSAKDPVQWSDSESKSKTAAKPAKAKAAPRKSVKKAVQEIGDKAEAYLSTASSTAGADADDDLSPVTSPLGANTGAKGPSGRDVSDMLEPKSAAPAVLKIGASEKPARQNKSQQQRPETPQETKKQRQNRRKAEEAKAQREADEKQRQILLEKQRRTAREARGEPARNGLQAAQAPTSNPWTTVRPSGAVQAPAPASTGQYLDTFEAASTASSSEAATNGTAPTPDSMSNSYNNLPSEEEQMRLAMEETAWTTVPNKKQRKSKPVGGDAEEGSDSGIPQEPAPAKPIPVKKTENTKPASKPASRFEVLSEPISDASHPMDSDWPVV